MPRSAREIAAAFGADYKDNMLTHTRTLRAASKAGSIIDVPEEALVTVTDSINEAILKSAVVVSPAIWAFIMTTYADALGEAGYHGQKGESWQQAVQSTT